MQFQFAVHLAPFSTSRKIGRERSNPLSKDAFFALFLGCDAVFSFEIVRSGAGRFVTFFTGVVGGAPYSTCAFGGRERIQLFSVISVKNSASSGEL